MTTVVLALGVIAAALLWVTVVRFKDEASATDCGAPLAVAWHGRLAPKMISELPAGVVPDPRSPNADPRYPGGFLRVPVGAHLYNVVCQGEARTRIAIAVAVILVAAADVEVSRRRWGRSARFESSRASPALGQKGRSR